MKVEQEEDWDSEATNPPFVSSDKWYHFFRAVGS